MLSVCLFVVFLFSSQELVSSQEEQFLHFLSETKKEVSFFTPTEQPLFMPILGVYSPEGEKSFIVGRIERGKLLLGEQVELVGLGPSRSLQIEKIEHFGKELKEGEVGQEVVVYLEGVDPYDLSPGQVLSEPKSIQAYEKFVCEAYLFPDVEGEEMTFFSDLQVQFHFQGQKLAGQAILLGDAQTAISGDRVKMEVHLSSSIAMYEGLWLEMSREGKAMGTCMVKKVLK